MTAFALSSAGAPRAFVESNTKPFLRPAWWLIVRGVNLYRLFLFGDVCAGRCASGERVRYRLLKVLGNQARD